MRENSESFFFGSCLFFIMMILMSLFGSSFLELFWWFIISLVIIIILPWGSNAIILFWNNRGFLEIDFFIDNLFLDNRVREHIRQVDVFKSIVFSLKITIVILLHSFLHFDRLWITGGSKKGKPLLSGIFGEVEEIVFFLVTEPDAVPNVRWFEPVFLCALAHV